MNEEPLKQKLCASLRRSCNVEETSRCQNHQTPILTALWGQDGVAPEPKGVNFKLGRGASGGGVQLTAGNSLSRCLMKRGADLSHSSGGGAHPDPPPDSQGVGASSPRLRSISLRPAPVFRGERDVWGGGRTKGGRDVSRG